jgi:serine/threonine protein kinase
MNFRIGAKLGRGPFGASYAAQLEADGSPVVVKVITSRFHEHPQLLERVLADLRAWSVFRHPNAAGTIGVPLYESRHVVVYEHAMGKPLDRWVKDQGPLDARAAVRVLRDVALVLAASHAQGLVCGDVRASKIYFDGQRAVITDLGQSRGTCLASGFGAAGLHFGHPDTLAPEVLAQQLDAPTPACDVYALGILLYELLVGAPPYRGEAQAVLRQHVEAPLPNVPVVQASPALARLLARLVAKSPAQRFPDGKAVLEGLYELIGRPPGAAPPVAAPPVAAPPVAAAASPLSQAPQLTSTVWRNVAEQLHATAQPASWTAERIEKPKPVGPAMPAANDPRTTTAALPRPLTTTVDDVASAQGQVEGSEEKKAAAIKLGKKLGQGPVGSAYHGEMKDHPHPVAIKVLSQRFAKYPDLHARILETIKKVEGMVDPRIVGVLRVVHVAGRDAVVAELCPGRPLREALRAAGKLPAKVVLDVLKDMALALQQGRGREVSHGDVRPEKVFVAEGQPARLADFGFYEAAGLGANFGQFGVPWGHPDYLAPEVVQEPKRLPDFQTDCYALGIMTYELLTGKPPFVGATPPEVLKAHLQAPLPPPPKEANVPAPLAELVLRLTAKDPKRRPEAPLELVAAIERCRKQVDLASQAVASPPVAEFDPTASGEKGEGWIQVDVPTSKLTKGHKKPVKATKSFKTPPPVAPDLAAPDMYQSEELRRPDA